MRLCPGCHHEIKGQMRFCPFCGSALAEIERDELIGTLIHERYRIEQKITETWLSVFYRALDTFQASRVIFQVVRQDVVKDALTAQRLLFCLSKLKVDRHPGIAVVRDFGSFADNDQYYIVLEDFDGVPLREFVKRRPLDFNEASVIVSEVGYALQVAHEAGITHSLFLPENIWILKSEDAATKVKLTDLGLPPATDATEPRPSSLPNIYCYLSPEQCLGNQGDERSGVYSLGVIAYELLVGKLPFEPDTNVSIVIKDTTPIRDVRSDVPAGLEAAIMRALDLSPRNRQPSPGRFAEEIARAAHLSSTPGLARPSVLELQNAKVSLTRTLAGTAAEISDVGEPQPDYGPPSVVRHSVETREAPREKPLYLDENVQFTVYRPKSVRPLTWSTMLAFAHLSERRSDAREDEPDPIAEVHRQAQRVLGERIGEYQQTVQDSSQAVPREGEITFIPFVSGIEFNPPSRRFLWQETVHREEFRLRASPSLDGQTARGRLSVFLGSILLAEVALSIRVDSTRAAEGRDLEAASARSYRKIFASYSHRDAAIVEQFERFAAAFGDRYLRDVANLRAGEVWSDRLEAMISEADIFQLFWSTNSMYSMFVRREWEYALALRRDSFIRPTYWEEPLPTAPEQNLPPEELGRLHFQRIGPGVISSSVSSSQITGALPIGNAAPIGLWSPSRRLEEIVQQPARPSSPESRPMRGWDWRDSAPPRSAGVGSPIPSSPYGAPPPPAAGQQPDMMPSGAAQPYSPYLQSPRSSPNPLVLVLIAAVIMIAGLALLALIFLLRLL